MQVLKEDLAAAAAAGLLQSDQVEPLVQFVAARRVSPRNVTEGNALSDLKLVDPASPLEDSEMPRFVRGFHDVLITIGVVFALVGLWGVGSVYAVLPAVIIMAEVLIKRQRLALPAVVLTIALTLLTALTMYKIVLYNIILGQFGHMDGNLYFFLFTGSFPVLLGLFYWRYKVPLALALFLYASAALILSSVVLLLARVFQDPDLLPNHVVLASALFFATAFCLFLIALSFDLKDPQRQTRLSDVAFWLHLVTAPALLYATLAFVYLDHFGGSWWTGDVSVLQAVATVVIVVVFMKIGLLLDRRAFVTSGLSSLSLAIWVLFDNSHFKISEAFFYIMVLVGLIVLSIGIFWPYLRQILFWFLPLSIKTKLPPLR